jgi:ATP-binding cassette subfamily B protein
MAFFGYLGMFYQPLTSLTLLSNWLSSFATAVQRIFEILDTTPQIREALDPVELPRVKGRIEFDRVTFGYDPYNPVVRNVSLTIEPGEMIGIVGHSGSGKTTVVNLLARFYDIQEGDIRIDGVSIREIALNDLRRQTAIVLQEPFLFRGTIADNIAYGGRPAGDNGDLERILEAAHAANAHDFIMDLPEGYDTYLGERGAGLSGGERQRVSIARALLCDPRILILDEATSSIDAEAERQIQDALRTVTQGRTTIAIAHRLSTLRHADRIVVIDDGRVAEQGSHDELMKQGGIYQRLVRIQTELGGEPSVERLIVDAKETKE